MHTAIRKQTRRFLRGTLKFHKALSRARYTSACENDERGEMEGGSRGPPARQRKHKRSLKLTTPGSESQFVNGGFSITKTAGCPFLELISSDCSKAVLFTGQREKHASAYTHRFVVSHINVFVLFLMWPVLRRQPPGDSPNGHRPSPRPRPRELRLPGV